MDEEKKVKTYYRVDTVVPFPRVSGESGPPSFPPSSPLGYLFSPHADAAFRRQASEQEISREQQRERQWVAASDAIETASCR